MRYAIGGDNVARRQEAEGAIVPLSVQYSPEYIDTLDKIRNTPVVTGDGRSVPLGDVADVSVRKMPEMIRNDNGNLAGYIYVDLSGRDAARLRGAGAAVPGEEPDAADGLLDRMDRAVRVRHGRSASGCGSSCR